MSEYVFTMYRADKFYGSDRQVLANISLSFLPARRSACSGRTARASRRCCGSWPARRRRRRNRRARPGATVGLLEQEPELDETKDVRENVEDGVRELRDLLDRFNAVSAEVLRARRRLRRAARRAGEGAGPDRPARRLAARPRTSTTRWTRCACRPATPTCRRSRAASGAASRSAGCCCGARPAAARRADEPPRRRVGRWLERFLPTTRAPSSPSPTTATSSTTSPAGSSSSTAAAASRTRATTRAGSSRSRQRLAHRGEDRVRAPAHARSASSSGCACAPKARQAKARRASPLRALLAEESERQARPVEIHIPPGRASATS
jgi:hypothetical protein